MTTAYLLHDLVFASAARRPHAAALVAGGDTLDYGELASRVRTFAAGLCKLGLARGDRVGIWLDKRFETVVAAFGAAAAGCVFVPLNPLLKPQQVGYILRDCNVRLLVTSAERLALVADELAQCADCRHVACVGDAAGTPLPGIA
ncbi:MAG: AMP-binding protein, partial [Burkholderiales bacterium]